jgi:hypothetical protein
MAIVQSRAEARAWRCIGASPVVVATGKRVVSTIGVKYKARGRGDDVEAAHGG